VYSWSWDARWCQLGLLHCGNVLSFIRGIAAVTVIRESTTVVTETWTIKCYGAMNLPLWLWCKGACVRVLDDCHLWTFCVVLRSVGNRSGWKMVDCVWNVMAHVQKSEFVFRRNGRVHLNRRGLQFSRLIAAEVCASAGVMLGTPCSEVLWRVLPTHSIRQFLLHFSSRASPCAITFQLDSAERNWAMPRQPVCGTSSVQVKRASSLSALNSRL
jgi:hypothetical protein